LVTPLPTGPRRPFGERRWSTLGRGVPGSLVGDFAVDRQELPVPRAAARRSPTPRTR
jgi:hypothetical protein